ncbi:MAG: adenylate kinase family protein [Solirubrobacteraceae bacterium]
MTTAVPPLIVLGPPGAGKGTQAKRLAERLGLVHLSPRQLLRDALASGGPLDENVRHAMAAGELVPNEIVDRLVQERLEQLAPHRGFVLDGYPRTPQQAEALRGMLARLGRLEQSPAVLWLEAPQEELMRRLRLRAAQEHRPDDNEQAIGRRLELHKAQAPSVLAALAGWADVARIDASLPADMLTQEILDMLKERVTGVGAAI